jgi:hypothetical protein
LVSLRGRGESGRLIWSKSEKRRKVETMAVVAKIMKRMSMKVFTPASKALGVGHRWG